MLYTAMIILGCMAIQGEFEVIKEGDTLPTTLKSYSKTHKDHPCVKWILHHKSHFEWALQHGFALVQVKQERYPNNPRHVCWYHFMRIHDVFYNSGWSYPTIPYNDLAQDALVRVATVNPPSGCAFGVLAFEKKYPQCVVDTPDGIDWIASYQAYYKVREQEFSTSKRPMAWNVVQKSALYKKARVS